MFILKGMKMNEELLLTRKELSVFSLPHDFVPLVTPESSFFFLMLSEFCILVPRTRKCGIYKTHT